MKIKKTNNGFQSLIESLQWNTFDVRRDRLKSVLLYKILN